MKYRLLGKTGIHVSEMGFGGWAIGGPVDLFGMPVGWDSVNDADSTAAIHRALELGVNFFDTADSYGSGHSEELLGASLQNKDCIVATKVGNARTPNGPIKDFSPGHMRASLESSLKRLKREKIDVYQLHCPPPEVWQSEQAFELLQQWKEEGKIRASGVSISSVEEGVHLIEKGKVDCLQVLFNVLNQEPARKLLPLAEEHGVGIIIRVPLASGLLTGKFQPGQAFSRDDNRKNYMSPKRLLEATEKLDTLKKMIHNTGYTMSQIALAFILKFPAVSTAIPGAKSAAQTEQNTSACDVVLSDALFDKIRMAFSEYNFFLRYRVRI